MVKLKIRLFLKAIRTSFLLPFNRNSFPTCSTQVFLKVGDFFKYASVL